MAEGAALPVVAVAVPVGDEQRAALAAPMEERFAWPAPMEEQIDCSAPVDWAAAMRARAAALEPSRRSYRAAQRERQR